MPDPTVLGERLSIFAFDTDYVLVREEQLDLAIDNLRVREHRLGDHAAGGR
jgi:hypothetical protein